MLRFDPDAEDTDLLADNTKPIEASHDSGELQCSSDSIVFSLLL